MSSNDTSVNDNGAFDHLLTTLRARVEYEISDASRDGPVAHSRTMKAMEQLQQAALEIARRSPERVEAISTAAQRGVWALIEEITGARTEEEWASWRRRGMHNE